jgi:hypothetical protein
LVVLDHSGLPTAAGGQRVHAYNDANVTTAARNEYNRLNMAAPIISARKNN